MIILYPTRSNTKMSVTSNVRHVPACSFSCTQRTHTFRGCTCVEPPAPNKNTLLVDPMCRTLRKSKGKDSKRRLHKGPSGAAQDVDSVVKTGCEAARRSSSTTQLTTSQFWIRSFPKWQAKSQRTEPRALRVSSVG